MKENADHNKHIPALPCLFDLNFEMADEEEDYYYYCAVAPDQTPNPPTSGCHNDQVMELLWQNGQVVIQAKQSHKKSEDHHHPVELIPAVVTGGSPTLQLNHHDSSLQPQHQQNNDIASNNLFIQEDEMATWILSDFCSDLLLLPSTAPAPSPTTVASHPARPPPAVPPPRRFENFGHFSRLNRSRATTVVEATVVDSSNTPMVARVSDDAAGHDVARVGTISTSAVVRDAANCDLTVTSSSGASSASSEPIPPVKRLKASPPLLSTRKTTTDVPEEGKRIASGGEDGERLNNGKDVELVHKEGRKHVRGGSSSTKRSLAAEVHNLSERRRRDRINEKMRALQELIPHCNKPDKASMLDEAIEYLKSLQMQVQMMSMGCGMMPMMYPYSGLQQYMPHMGTGLGIGMGMEVGMNGPMVQFPHVFTSSGGAGPPMCPRFRFPAFWMPPPIPAPNNQPDTVLNSVSPHNSSHPRMPGFMDPYQQFLGLQHMHSPLHQANTSSSSLATTSKAGENTRKVSPD